MASGHPRKGYREPDGPDIPLKPLQNWVEQQLAKGFGVLELAARMGVTDRTLRRVRRGERTIKVLNPVTKRRRHVVVGTDVWGRYRVEDMLARAGADFYDLYPQFEGEWESLHLAYWWCPVCRCEQWSAFPECPDCDEEMSPQFEDAA